MDGKPAHIKYQKIIKNFDRTEKDDEETKFLSLLEGKMTEEKFIN